MWTLATTGGGGALAPTPAPARPSRRLHASAASAAWLESIQHAVVSVVSAPLRAPDDAQNKIQAEASMQYLLHLESILLANSEQQQQWNRPPRKAPPPLHLPTGLPVVDPQVPPQPLPSSRRTPCFHGNNPYGVFGVLDDDDEDDDDDSEEAGDTPVLHRSASSTFAIIYTRRRLAIRVWTSQADVCSHLACLCRNLKLYPEGAERCTIAVDKIRQALSMADSAVSKWFTDNHDERSNEQEYRDLVEDSSIVSVSLGHLVGERDRFLRLVQREAARLLGRLQPQWEARDEIRNRIGMERWRNNPRPKRDYALIREQDEEALKQIQQAEAVLQGLDTNALQSTSDEIKHRLESHLQPQQQQQRPAARSFRYNGLRPTNLQDHVSTEDYPDPTELGWTFTGSNEASRVEFFERLFDDADGNAGAVAAGAVKLDWYYTTGTVKTSMDHPSRGRTQLFGSRVTPELYQQILANPRQYTNVRYRTRRGNNNNGNNDTGGRSANGGRGRGRGRGRGGDPGRGNGTERSRGTLS